MIEFEKISCLISKSSWEELSDYFDELVVKNSESQSEKNWFDDYSEQKIEIIRQLEQKFEEICQSVSQENSLEILTNFEEAVIKIFAKGLILPELNHYEDLNFLHKLISTSKNCKYLFMLYQENLIEIRETYQHESTSTIDKINLKSLSIIPAFLKLAGQIIFSDILNKFHEFYSYFRKIEGEENVIGEPDKELVEFFNHFADKTLNELQKLTKISEDFDLTKKLIEKPIQRKEYFSLLKLLHLNNPDNSKEIKELVNISIAKLQFGLKNFDEVPSFWISDNFQELCKIYNKENLFFVIGSILIAELPSRPEYAQISNHLLSLLQWSIAYLLERNDLINSLSFGSNSQFFIQFFERLSILMGLLNSNENEKQINQLIKVLFSKKDLFSSFQLVEILWRKLIGSHEDINFKIFCLGQYKKVFLLPVKEITHVEMHILTNGSEFMVDLVSKLEGNSNAEFIGFILTLVIYYFSFLRKIQNFFLEIIDKNSEKKIKSQCVLRYVFNEERIHQIKEEMREKLFKLKESLKDRLEVYKMKSSNQQEQSTQIEKETNEISICLYRIEEEIKFD